MPIDAVIFDWGGTLTAWHDIDFHAESLALAQAVVNADHDLEVSRERLHRAGSVIWGRSRDPHQSATVADLFDEAGLEHDPGLLSAYYDFWEPHTYTDPAVRPTWEALRADGVRIGVLSNTIWPRAWHRGIFERDGVLDLVDGDVYSSEIPWTKPSPKAFAAALEAVGATDPARYAGLLAVHLPHSTIPPEQVGHTEGEPDAVIQALDELPDLIRAWGSHEHAAHRRAGS
jgi:putative hydrolase of the HAD superfamily